ncbi:hypothetical protein F503_07586 [Ophiostoma piceae UAMH 11346]|uniref:Duf221 domain-containing protein n=1 Tax=Ophiostoma piceae (strain UAMH 11346) TaxID=1262450 RepID=S3D8M7_OPHP1|nr:hypothetical protein F503_07586 [Ophiostoma piceae UAMH 11346]
MMDWTSLAIGLEKRINQSSDPRLGSSRDNSTTGTLSHVTSSGTDSSSAASLGSTFVPVLVYSGVCLAIFFVFRPKCRRVYAARTIPSIRRDPLVPIPELPNTWFSWIKDFYKIDDAFILNNTSLDAFLFLRYLRVLATICFAGCVISWPVLLSVNATGGNNLKELNLLTIGDVSNPYKFYAHALIAWIYFGFILMMICRECIYYINLRQAYLTTPQHMHRLSARTVLFTCVPERFLDEPRVRKLFGDSVKNVWIPRNTRQLERLVKERENAAIKLEKAEIELIRKANKEREKQLKAGIKGNILSLPFPGFSRGAKAKAQAVGDAEAAHNTDPNHPSLAGPIRSNTNSSLASATLASSSNHSALGSASVSSPFSSPPNTPRPHSTRSAAPGSPLSPATTVVARAPTNSLSLRRASGQSRASVEHATLPVSTSSSANVLQNTLSPGMIREIRDINYITGPSHAHATSPNRHGSVSDAGSSPSMSATAVASTMASPMTDITEVATVSTAGTSVDGDSDDKEGQDGQNIQSADVATNDKDVKIEAPEYDDDDEKHYVHPYGYADNLPDVRGSIAAQWLTAEKRPGHRPIANFGRRVDTIRWTRQRIKSLNKDIAKLRRQFRAGDGDTMSSMFVEFDTQAAAQVAFQVLTHHQPLHMSPRFIGVRPQDVIWSSLRMRWWERIMRRFLIMGAIAVGVVFWSVPAALVGVVSNISFLTSKVFFLKWIASLPSAITGVIEGLLPAVALSLLMAAVPSMLRGCARTAGIVSEPMVELYTQNAYFCFQVVQVFLITTLTSAASAAFTQILEDPLSAKDLLSENLPKASNFYLSYITVQCLAGGAIGMVHFFDLFRHTLLAKTMKHPRRAVRNFQLLRKPHWGGVFPVYTNMGVIAISYTCIAPLILIFAGVGMLVVYQVYKYNLLYAYDSDRDSTGLHYPRGLMHLMIGLYLAQVCLIGLFGLQAAVGPVIMIIMFLVFTVLVHISLNDAVTPLLYNLPLTLALEDKDLAKGHEDLRNDAKKEAAEAAAARSSSDSGGGLNADYYNMEEAVGEGSAAASHDNAVDDFDPDEHYGLEDDPDDALHEGPVSTRGLAKLSGFDGAGDLMGLVTDWGRERLKKSVKADVQEVKADARSFSMPAIRISPERVERMPLWLSKRLPRSWTHPDASSSSRSGNFILRWLQPQVYEDYTFLQKMLPMDEPPIAYPKDYWRRGYWPPEMWKPIPKLWIPRDVARVSRQEVAHTRAVLPITDHGAWLTAKGNVEADMDKAPFLEPIYIY